MDHPFCSLVSSLCKRWGCLVHSYALLQANLSPWALFWELQLLRLSVVPLSDALEATSLDTKMPLSLTPCQGAPGLTPIMPISKQIIFKRIYTPSSRKCSAANNRNLSSGHAMAVYPRVQTIAVCPYFKLVSLSQAHEMKSSSSEQETKAWVGQGVNKGLRKH